MNDRELLEFAAAAFWAGEIDDVCSVEWGEQDNCILYIHGDNQDHNGADRTYRWNPLEENSDAFELAVKLGLTINPYKRGVFVSRNEAEPVIREEWGDDDAETTRRAIVRAAAEIGKALP